jgi:IS1 family transposase
MNSGHSSLKKENITEDEKADNPLQKGDRWTFMAVLPESSYIHAVHSGQRNGQEAKTFVQKIKSKRDGQAPFIESDGWFYENVLTEVYGILQETPYKGRGRKPLSKFVPDPKLKYAQVVKERENGTVVKVSTRIVLGDELEILDILDRSERCNTISTSFVESRNGAFRKDNKRQARKTKCHSKKSETHYAHVIFLKGIYNLTKETETFRTLINPEAKLFETKYKKASPAMKQGLVNQIYPMEDLLLMKPLMFNIN